MEIKEKFNKICGNRRNPKKINNEKKRRIIIDLIQEKISLRIN